MFGASLTLGKGGSGQGVFIKADTCKSMRPDELQPRVLRELADVIVKPPFIIFERLWQVGEVPEDWKRANVAPVFSKGKKEDQGYYRTVSLTSVPGKVMDELILEIFCVYEGQEGDWE